MLRSGCGASMRCDETSRDIGMNWLAGWLWAEHRHERARGETKRKRRNAGGRSVCLGLARARQCEKDTRERELDMGHVHVHAQALMHYVWAPEARRRATASWNARDIPPITYQRKWPWPEKGSRAAGCSCRMFWKESVNVTGTVSNSAICETWYGVAGHWSLPYDGMQY